MHRIKFIPDGKEIFAEEEESVFSAAMKAGVDTGGVCGGRGFCGKCKVRIIGKVTPLTPAEKKFLTEKEVSDGIRLACQVHPLGDIEVISMYNKIVKLAKMGYEPDIPLNPAVSLQILNGKAAVEYWRDGHRETLETIELKDGDKIYGLAVDIGTTKIVIYLMDLITGEILLTNADENPQTIFGADVMTRIMKSLELGVDKLRRMLIAHLNRKLLDFERRGIERARIYEIVVVGNSVMHHFFVGRDVRPLAYSPYKLKKKEAEYIPAKELKLRVSAHAHVYLPPLVESFVGSDSLVGAYLMRYKSAKRYIFIDLGTNAEVFLSYEGGMLATSGPAGPAFEGMNIKYGMRSAVGAIEGVAIDPETLEPSIKVIGNTKPCGIAGSGLIDAVAEMLKNGIIDYGGRFRVKNHPYIREEGGKLEYILSKDGCDGKIITLTQKDIRELQLAKAAVQTAIHMLLRKAGLSSMDMEKIYVAGSFGLYINPQNAMFIGLLPEVPLDRIELVGNTAGSGARILLKNRDVREDLENFAKKVQHVDLVRESDFHEIFINSTYLPSGYVEDYPGIIKTLEKVLGKPRIKKVKKM